MHRNWPIDVFWNKINTVKCEYLKFQICCYSFMYRYIKINYAFENCKCIYYIYMYCMYILGIQLQSWHDRKWQRAFKHCMASLYVSLLLLFSVHLKIFKSLSCTTYFVLLKRGRMFNCFRCFGVSLPSFMPCACAAAHLSICLSVCIPIK